jgi:serine protease
LTDSPQLGDHQAQVGIRRLPSSKRRIQVKSGVVSRPWGIDMVNVSSLWTIPPKKDVKICIIDTGYDTNHTDLPNKNVTGWVKKSTCGSNITKQVDWSTDEDDDSHGTHVSGIISAIMNYNSEFDRYHMLPEHTISTFIEL